VGKRVARASGRALNLRVAQPAEEEALAELPKKEREHEGLVAEDEQAQLGRGEVDDLRAQSENAARLLPHTRAGMRPRRPRTVG
jgi:hypothetical protein